MFTWGRINSLFGHQQGFIRGLHVYMGKDKFIVRSSTRFYKRSSTRFLRGLHVYMGKDKFIVRSSTRFYKRISCLHGEG